MAAGGDHGLFLILNVAIGGELPRQDGASPGPATDPGHPMRIDHVTVSTRQGAVPPQEKNGQD